MEKVANKWIRGQRLGNGSFGEVFIAIPTNPYLPLMAVKSAPEHTASSLLLEYNILQIFRGAPGIIQCHGFGISTGQPDTCAPVTYDLLLEYASGGSLTNVIKSYGGGIPEKLVRDYTRELLKALCIIHSHGYTHCDIKPDNILVFPDSRNPEISHLKIADFGLAVEAAKIHPRNRDFRGTPRYAPYELAVFGRVTTAMDIWALGCTVIEMLTGVPPWNYCKDKNEVMMEIRKGRPPQIPEWLSEEGKDFLNKCFLMSWVERLPAGLLLLHPFVNEGWRSMEAVVQPLLMSLEKQIEQQQMKQSYPTVAYGTILPKEEQEQEHEQKQKQHVFLPEMLF
ncbi:Mitogen-activated protein kinase kinase kinase 20 [Linum perenne]